MSACPSHLAWEDPPESVESTDFIAVVHDGAVTYVDPDSVRLICIQGRLLVPLAELWSAEHGDALGELCFHFEGDDGYQTRDESDVGVPGLLLEHAYIDVATRDVLWTTEVPSFVAVKGLSAISAQHASEIANIEISID